MENFETEAHSEEQISDINQLSNRENVRNYDFLSDTKLFYRFFKKKLSRYFRKKEKKYFTRILYVTLKQPPVDFIHALTKQYPDKEFRVLVPIDSVEGLIKTNFSFEFFIQNKNNTAYLYKFPKTRDNIEVYGLYSMAFAGIERKRLQFLAPFTKALRICIARLKPDIVHSDDIPFYLGAEFEKRMPASIKVFQTIKDFSLLEMNKTEAFWAAINLVNQECMKKLCRDKIIKKCIATLFNLHNTKRFYQMRECLGFIYENYYKFRKFVDKCEDIEENILFNRMNSRVLKLFPQMVCNDDDMYYNLMAQTLKKTDKWAVVSKTYFDDVFENPTLSGKLYNCIKKTENKADFINIGLEIKPPKLYQEFSVENFREYRQFNKKYLRREFSEQRIKTKFIDSRLFLDKEFLIRGYLDSFYEAPLLLAKFEPEVFAQGVDIALNTILKLFEQNKNIQVILNIKDGFKNNYIKSWIEFLEKNVAFNGRWVFIDSDINLEQFSAASDIILLPKRLNIISDEHFTAMKFGCVPVASKVGIYNDSIVDIFDDMTSGCGFKTKTTLYIDKDVNSIYIEALLKALNMYEKNSSSWNLLIKNCMNYDSTWNFETIEKYNEIYNSL